MLATPIDFIPPTPLTSEEIKKQTREEDENFIETLLALREEELKAADEIADEENKNVIKSIVDPTPSLVLDDEINDNDVNIPPNTTDNIYQLPPKVEKELNDIFVDGIIPQQKFDNELTIDIDYEDEVKQTKIVVPLPKDYAQIEKSSNKSTVEIYDYKVEDTDVDIKDNDDVDFVSITSSHPRDRLRRKTRNRDNKERDGLYITRVNPAHPRYRMRRILRNRPVNLEVDAEVLQDSPYLNTKIKVGELNKVKRCEAIFDVIIKQLLPNNDPYYVEHNRVRDSFELKKDNKISKVKASEAIRKKYKKMKQNKDKVKKTAKMAINELRKSKHIQTDDTQTVNYNNDINLDDVDPSPST